MYSLNFSKEKDKFLDKKIYQNLSRNNVGKNFLEVYKEIGNTPKNKIEKSIINKSIKNN
ncbi:hypothetical protein [Streptococcus sp. HCA-5024]|uniref:hypothetical protein n=1 Tax=Streptococcus sp. HCA-5024 TaxID=3134665 RepID=UPI0030BD00C7